MLYGQEIITYYSMLLLDVEYSLFVIYTMNKTDRRVYSSSCVIMTSSLSISSMYAVMPVPSPCLSNSSSMAPAFSVKSSHSYSYHVPYAISSTVKPGISYRFFSAHHMWSFTPPACQSTKSSKLSGVSGRKQSDIVWAVIWFGFASWAQRVSLTAIVN